MRKKRKEKKKKKKSPIEEFPKQRKQKPNNEKI
jgi:hypothetical protein